MPDEIVVVDAAAIEAAQETAVEAIAEEIAIKVEGLLEEDEEETKWVVDLFRSEFAPVKEQMRELQQQISALLLRVPDQESYNRMQESLTRIVEAKLIAESVTPSPMPEVVVIPEPEAIPEPEPVANAEDAEKVPKTESQVRKHKRL